jgi:hypothetical protein
MMGLIDIQAKFSPHPVRIQLDSLPAAGQETIQAQVLAIAEAEWCLHQIKNGPAMKMEVSCSSASEHDPVGFRNSNVTGG